MTRVTLRTLGTAVLLAVSVASVAYADTVLLTNGGKIDGIVTEEGEWYLVEMDAGTARIRKAEVSSVLQKKTILEEYREKTAQLADDDAQGHYQLGLWCKSAGLKRSARLEFQKTIAANPEHAEARKELGYVKHEGAWMTEAQAMEAKGFVKYEGNWILREERDLRESLKAKERLEAQVKKAEAEARKAEMEAKLATAKRELAEAQRELAEARQRRDLSSYNEVPYYGGFSWIWTSPYYNGYAYRYYPSGYWSYDASSAHVGHGWVWHPYSSQPVSATSPYYYYPYYPYYYSPYHYSPYYYPYYSQPSHFRWWIQWH